MHFLTDRSVNGSGWVGTPDKACEFSEPQVMKLVYAAASRGELITKQCPWRIGVYYYPRLVSLGLLREHTDLIHRKLKSEVMN
ncbi:MAG: hypothetical protein JWN34_901 [Bryobacterales bacterium]|nr:hypothetical protein [Bryobacterales bacterium]